MTRRRGRLLALTALLAIGPSPALAQTPPLPSPLTLERAVDRFLARNLAVEAARHRVDGARAERLAAGLRPNPTLTLEAEDVKLSGPTPAGDLYEVTSSVSYPIELGDKRRLRVEAADASVAVAEARLTDVLQQRLADLKRAFYDVLLARAQRGSTRGRRGRPSMPSSSSTKRGSRKAPSPRASCSRSGSSGGSTTPR